MGTQFKRFNVHHMLHQISNAFCFQRHNFILELLTFKLLDQVDMIKDNYDVHRLII
jgi:hypothetical protein